MMDVPDLRAMGEAAWIGATSALPMMHKVTLGIARERAFAHPFARNRFHFKDPREWQFEQWQREERTRRRWLRASLRWRLLEARYV